MKMLLTLTAALVAALTLTVAASAGPHDGADSKGKAQTVNVYVYCTHGTNAVYCDVSGTLGNGGDSSSCSGWGCNMYFPHSGSGWGTACGRGYGCKGFGFATGQVIRITF